jgi:glutamine synthetase
VLGEVILKLKSKFFRSFTGRESSSSGCDAEIGVVSNSQIIVDPDEESYAAGIEKRVEYILSPGIFYIKNHIDDLLESVLEGFHREKYIPRIGLEIEFYAPRIDKLEALAAEVNKFSKLIDISLAGTTEEVGYRQFEIDLNPYTDIKKLISDFTVLKNFLTDGNFSATFDAMPIDGQPRSALQISVSIASEYGENLFAKNSGEESELLLNSVAGILETTNRFLPLYIKSTENLLVFDLEFNKIEHLQKRNPVPTYNSWGLNNRSCSIRIPTPKNFRSKDEYKLECETGRRLEFRVPSSDCDIKCAIFGVLYSVLYGIVNKLKPSVEATSNNVLEHHDSYRKIAIEDSICDFLI